MRLKTNLIYLETSTEHLEYPTEIDSIEIDKGLLEDTLSFFEVLNSIYLR